MTPAGPTPRPARPVALASLALLVAVAVAAVCPAPAWADHTDPGTQVATPPSMAVPPVASKGAWSHLGSLGANPGSDLEVFTREGQVFSSSGTLGQGAMAHVGQRIVRLVDRSGRVAPTFVADHGSAACLPVDPGDTLALQHDVQATSRDDPELLVDTTDAPGRCHDPAGGGLELLDVSGVGRAGGAPVRELHLTRHDGTSHNATVDANRPWVVYNSNTDTGRPWIDVVDVRSCLGLEGRTLAEKRAACRPVVHRIPFEPTWTAQQLPDGTLANPTGCHDITSTKDGRLYCAAITGTAIFDVSGLTDGAGKVRGRPLPCTLVNGTRTSAKVTNCDLGAGDDSEAGDVAAYEQAGRPAAEGWRFLGSVNHPGPDETGTTNTAVSSTEGVAISHEADPTPDGRHMLVTDERGGGVVPPGASCTPGVANPVGNGGMHVFDVSDPSRPTYARSPNGGKAVFVSTNVLPMPSFCNIHVVEQVPDEARIFMAWYSQGIKVVDYRIDADGRWSFDEVGFLTLPGANTWAAEAFRIVDNPDGTRTYFVLASDVTRGIDVVSFTAVPNRLPTPPASGRATTGAAPGGPPGSPGPTSSVLPPTGGPDGLAPPALFALLPLALLLSVAARRSRRRVPDY